MKSWTILLLASVMCFASIHSNAQSPDESKIKILRTDRPGIIRLVYALKLTDPVTVSFRSNRGDATTDYIKGSTYPQGFSKRYDVREIKNDEFWIEIASPEMTTIYHIVPGEDGENFTSRLEKTIHNHLMAAAK